MSVNFAIDNSINFADNVVKNLVAHTVGVPVMDIFADIHPTKKEILIDYKAKNKRYCMSLDLVDKDYMLDLGNLKDEGVFKSVKARMAFLLNMTTLLYCPIVKYMQEWANDNGRSFEYLLEVDINNTTLYLDKNSEKRIGIMLREVE